MQSYYLRAKSYFLLFISCALFLALPVQSQNYDESKVGDYTLPDPLVTQKGKAVTSAKAWEAGRRKEILRLFEEHVYGVMPAKFDAISFELVNEDRQAMAGKAHLKEVRILVANGGQQATLNLVLFTPNGTSSKVPVFLLINNRPARNTDAKRDTLSGFWPAEEVIAAGYGVAAFQVADAAPDKKDDYQSGILRLFPEMAQRKDGMKAIGAWAWAASRALDYFETDPQTDAKKVIVVGHSRGGKTSLWAAAQDRRFAMCISNNSGNTGAKISRRNFGESVERINGNFPHWFADNYTRYNGKESELPVDQHMLLALLAPRPLYLTNATEDLWADPTGTYLALKAAEPVFNLYREKSSLPSTPPSPDTPLLSKPIGYHNRTGKHNMTYYDWAQFVQFADLYFKKEK
jgi:hypothetical protein